MKITGKITHDPCPHSRFDPEHWRRIPGFALMLHNPTGALFEIGGFEPYVYAQLVYVQDDLGAFRLGKEIDLGHEAVAAFRDEFERWEPEEPGVFREQLKGPVIQ
jgi:hypothetical protein